MRAARSGYRLPVGLELTERASGLPPLRTEDLYSKLLFTLPASDVYFRISRTFGFTFECKGCLYPPILLSEAHDYSVRLPGLFTLLESDISERLATRQCPVPVCLPRSWAGIMRAGP